MSAWTVVLSDQFRSDLDSIQEEFSRRLAKLKNTGDAEKEWRAWEEFQVFASTALDMEDGSADPAKVLKPYDAKSGISSTHQFKSASGRWTGSFSADPAKKTYFGIKVYEKAG